MRERGAKCRQKNKDEARERERETEKEIFKTKTLRFSSLFYSFVTLNSQGLLNDIKQEIIVWEISGFG